MYDVRWQDVRLVAFSWIDAIQRIKQRPAQMVVGLAVTFLLVCHRFGLEPRDVLEVAARVLNRARDVTPQYPRGIEEYLRNEVPNV